MSLLTCKNNNENQQKHIIKKNFLICFSEFEFASVKFM